MQGFREKVAEVFRKDVPGDESKKKPPIVEGEIEDKKDVTLGSLINMIPSVSEGDLEVEPSSNLDRKRVIKKDRVDYNFENFRTAFKGIIKNIDKARLTAVDRKKIVDAYMGNFEYFERLVGKKNDDPVFEYFEEKIKVLRKDIESRLIQ